MVASHNSVSSFLIQDTKIMGPNVVGTYNHGEKKIRSCINNNMMNLVNNPW